MQNLRKVLSIIPAILIIVGMAILSGCTSPMQVEKQTGKSKVSSQASNQTTITSQEQTQLNALQPQIDSIIVEVFGSKDALSAGKQLDLNKLSIFKDKVTTILKSQFGNNYSKFITGTS